MIEKYLPAAASYASDVDQLIWVITLMVGFWFILAEGVFFWLIFKFRAKEGRRAQYITGEKKEETRFITYPHLAVLVCDVVIIVMAINVWSHIKQSNPKPDAVVRVIAQQWAWSFVHPGPDGKLDTDDDIRTVDELRVEVDKNYEFELEARDVVHSFSVPVFRLKQDAVPGRVITGWFKPTKTGTFDIQCAEICGIGHGLMPARIVIETPEQHAAWVAAHAQSTVAQASP